MMGGSQSSKSASSKLADVDVKYSENNYPPLKPPKTKKAIVFNPQRFTAIDEKAKSTSRQHALTYDGLIKYLTNGLQNDVQKVRSIYVWLASQRIMDENYDKAVDANTPLGYMRLIQNDRGTYEQFFALLCRTAKLPCVVVQGNIKSVTYDVGDMDIESVYGYWNLVYLDGSWRIINPKWAMVSIGNYINERWSMMEKDGASGEQSTDQGSLVYVYCQDDFYFLTDPEEHIYRCLPCDRKCQLLEEPWTMEKFLSVPLVTNEFFTSGLKLPDKTKGIVKATEGEVEFNLQVSQVTENLKYELYFEQKKKKKNLQERTQMSRYVFLNSVRNKRCFFVRLQTEGLYRLTILSETETPLCDFRIDCTGVKKTCEPFPKNPEIGWGFGETAKKAGLSNPSQEHSIVTIDSKKSVDFTFNVKKDLQVNANLLHNEIPTEELKKHVSKQKEGDKLTVTVDVPTVSSKREYALEINAKNKGNDSYKNVANYLLTTESRQPIRKTTKGNIQNTSSASQKASASDNAKEPLQSNGIAHTNNASTQASLDTEPISSDGVNDSGVKKKEGLFGRFSLMSKKSKVEASTIEVNDETKTLDSSHTVIANGTVPTKDLTGENTDQARKGQSLTSKLAKNKTYSFRIKSDSHGVLESSNNVSYPDVDEKDTHCLSPGIQASSRRASGSSQNENSSRKSSRKSSLADPLAEVDYSRPARIKRMKDAYLSNNSAKDISSLKSPTGLKPVTPKHDVDIGDTNTDRLSSEEKTTTNSSVKADLSPKLQQSKGTSSSSPNPNQKNLLQTKTDKSATNIATSDLKNVTQKVTVASPVTNATNQKGKSLHGKAEQTTAITVTAELHPTEKQSREATKTSTTSSSKDRVGKTTVFTASTHLRPTGDLRRTGSMVTRHMGNPVMASGNSSTNTQRKSLDVLHVTSDKKRSTQETSLSIPSSTVRRSSRPKHVENLCQDLQKAIDSRQLSEINKILEETGAHVITPNPKLTELKARAENVRTVIKRLNKYLHEVMSVNQCTIAEIHSYSHPKPVVHDVMRATFLLLGERGSQLRKWHYVQQLMRRSSKEGLVMRIQEFDIHSISLDLAEYVKEILDAYDPDVVRLTSTGAGAFYNWCRNIITEVEQNAKKAQTVPK